MEQSMEAYIDTVVGVSVSILLFLVGYRQTVGATKERTRIANAELEGILLKRIVLESYVPSAADIDRLIDGKARDHKVRTRNLMSPEQLLGTLYTRIVETDFITPAQRREIIERIVPALGKTEVVNEPELLAVQAARRTARYSTALTLWLGVMSSTVGALVAGVPELIDPGIGEVVKQNRDTLLGVFGLSIGLIATLLIIFRSKDLQEEPTRNQALDTAVEFEGEVAKALDGLGITTRVGQPDRGFDFCLEVGGRKILVEAKHWGKRAPLGLLGNYLRLLHHTRITENADEAILVTKDKLPLPTQLDPGDPNVRVMSLSELRNYLAHFIPKADM